MTRRLVLATRNEHKVHELRQILAGLVDELGLEVVGADDVDGAPDVAETEVTFLGNARLKAVALARPPGCPRSPTTPGWPSTCSAGRPGCSPRAGRGRRRARTPARRARPRQPRPAARAGRRRARRAPGGGLRVRRRRRAAGRPGRGRRGRVDGRARARRRAAPTASATTRSSCPTATAARLAEYTDVEKNAISHRGNAFRALEPVLRELLCR